MRVSDRLLRVTLGKSRRDYTAEAVAAARSVLIELVQLLGEFRDQMVVASQVGGG